MHSDTDIAASYIYNIMLEDEQKKMGNMLLDEDEQQKIDKKSEDVKND